MTRRVWPAAIFSVVVLAASAVAWVVSTEILPETRVRVSDVEAEIAQTLPKGSSESGVMAFLRTHDYGPVAAMPFTGSDGFLTAQGVPLGTLVIRGYIQNSSRRGLLETGDITIFILLDDARRVDRAYVLGQFTGP